MNPYDHCRNNECLIPQGSCRCACPSCMAHKVWAEGHSARIDDAMREVYERTNAQTEAALEVVRAWHDDARFRDALDTLVKAFPPRTR